MNRLIVVRTLLRETPLALNQATVIAFDEATMGHVHLVVEVRETDGRIDDCAILGYANEFGDFTQIASIDDIAAIFGLEGAEIARELRDAIRSLVEMPS